MLQRGSAQPPGPEPGGDGGPPPGGQGLRQRVRAAWELAQPPSYQVEAEASALPEPRMGRIEAVEEALASIAFFGTFATIVVEVVARSVFNRPVVWSLELPTYLFFWAFSLAAGLNDWRDEQISFPLLADKLPERLRLGSSAVANLLIAVPMLLVLPGTFSFLSYESGQPSTGLPFNQVWGYAGVVLLFGLGAILRGRLCFQQLRRLGGLLRHRIEPAQ